MKNIQKAITMAIFISMLILPSQMRANNLPVKSSSPIESPVETARAQILLDRLDQIKSLDKKDISTTEKKALKQETKSIKKELKQISGGVYLSAGTLIIILLILIILL
jgi:hypothetical protein